MHRTPLGSPDLVGWVERPREAHRRASALATSAWQPVQQLPQLLPLRRVNDIIGIEPERIVAGGPRQRRVAGRGEVIDPDEIEHPSPELAAISRVRSLDPVSTTTISSNSPATDDKHFEMLSSSSLTIIVRLTETEDLCPQISQMNADEMHQGDLLNRSDDRSSAGLPEFLVVSSASICAICGPFPPGTQGRRAMR